MAEFLVDFATNRDVGVFVEYRKSWLKSHWTHRQTAGESEHFFEIPNEPTGIPIV